MPRELNRVGVVGLGTMGAGIVEVFARNGIEVVAVEVDAGALARGQSTVASSTDRAVQRGRLAADERDTLLNRITFAPGLAPLADVDLVVEAVPEYLDLKRQIFSELHRVCRPDVVLATNTSSLSVTESPPAASGRRGCWSALLQPAAGDAPRRGDRRPWSPDSVVAGVQTLFVRRIGKIRWPWRPARRASRQLPAAPTVTSGGGIVAQGHARRASSTPP